VFADLHMSITLRERSSNNQGR